MTAHAHSHKRLFFNRVLPLLLCFLLGFLIWVSPHSQEINANAWQLFAIFVATIVAIIFKPLPMGALALIAIAIATTTHTLTLEQSLSGFSNDIVWLVLMAFFIAKAFIKSGLGTRIGYSFISIFGKKTLGLSYGLLLSELILAPAIPSVTARAGGVIFPIIQGLAKSYGSDPLLGTERKIGAFLFKVAYQGSVITSAMFLTAMAANPMIAKLVEQAGFEISWSTWAIAALVPGILSLIFMPLVIYFLFPPEIKSTPDAPILAKSKLKELGRIKKAEWLMIMVFILLLVLWIFGKFFDLKATTAAFIGVGLLILAGVLTWHDILREENGWDTFIWFATLLMLAGFLNQLGFIPWLSEQIVETVGNWDWHIAFFALAIVYFYSHYFFASNTAHVGAMFTTFLLIAIGIGTPPIFAILVLAFFSNLFGGLTHYGSGPAPLFFGAGYLSIKMWWFLGFCISIVNILIWLGIGSLWWKLLGLI